MKLIYLKIIHNNKEAHIKESREGIDAFLDDNYLSPYRAILIWHNSR